MFEFTTKLCEMLSDPEQPSHKSAFLQLRDAGEGGKIAVGMDCSLSQRLTLFEKDDAFNLNLGIHRCGCRLHRLLADDQINKLRLDRKFLVLILVAKA